MAPLKISRRRLIRSLLLLAAAGSAGAQPADRASVYAAFTLNVARFVSWPPATFPAADSPLVIGTAEHDPINPALDHAAGLEPVNGHPVRTIRIRGLEDLAACHVVFLSEDTPRQPAILARLKDLPVLTIGDSPGFLELGGHVGFVRRASRVAIKVEPRHLKASGLEARAQLLRLAETPKP